MMEQETPIRG